MTSAEYWTVFDTLKASGHLNDASRYAGVSLHEPPKAEVLGWKPGDPFRREALAIVKQGRQTFEAVVDIRDKKITSWKEIPGVEPMLIADETEGADGIVKADPRWQAAMRERGITDFETVSCDGDSPGYFGTAEERENGSSACDAPSALGIPTPERTRLKGWSLCSIPRNRK